MFTPDRNGTPEMVEELMRNFNEATRQIKFRPLALIWKPFRRTNRQSTITRPVGIRRTTISFEEY